MAKQLTATAENDARVAREGFGWRLVYSEFGELWVAGINEFKARVDEFKPTTDPALVVPMLERIGELAGCEVDLSRDRDGQYDVFIDDPAYNDSYFDGEFDAPTANLALCAALLAVAEAVKGESDG